MNLSGARGPVRLSKNRECDILAAMVLDRVNEPDFFRQVTGHEYAGEYGERASARRRGKKFETNLHMNNAALLRRSLAPILGLDAEAMWVRDFEQEVPGAKSDLRAVRMVRTKQILMDLAEGKRVPDLVIQPQFKIRTGPGRNHFISVSPDFMALDPAARIYVPGEEKSFITRQNVADPADLDLARRQAAAQILALRALTQQLGLADRVSNRAFFVLATPFGLTPAAPRAESLDAEVYEIALAIERLIEVRGRLEALREARGYISLANLFDELERGFKDSCHGACLMASVCKAELVGRAQRLGDRAGAIASPDMEIVRLYGLLKGIPPATDRERELVSQLRAAATALDLEGVRRRWA